MGCKDRREKTHLSNAHLTTPAKLAKRHEGTHETAIHLIQQNVRAPDIDEVLVRLVQLIEVEKLVITPRKDIASLFIEDDASTFSNQDGKRGESVRWGRTGRLCAFLGLVRTFESVSEVLPQL